MELVTASILDASLILMQTTQVGNVIELRPGAMLEYFDRQNELRPLWVIDHPVDDPVLRDYLQDSLNRLVQGLGDL